MQDDGPGGVLAQDRTTSAKRTGPGPCLHGSPFSYRNKDIPVGGDKVTVEQVPRNTGLNTDVTFSADMTTRVASLSLATRWSSTFAPSPRLPEGRYVRHVRAELC